MNDDTEDFVFSRDMHPEECACELCTVYAWAIEQYAAERRAQRDAATARRRERQRAKIWDMMDRSDPDGCWGWKGFIRPDGYGRASWTGYSQLAHRMVYQIVVGPIPAELEIDHKCRNRKCVRPEHLHAVTVKQNRENLSQVSARAKSGIRGVHWDGQHGRWSVVVRHDGRNHWGGYFSDKHDAGAAAIALRNTLHTNNLADRGVFTS
jgi:hypothetical protein